MQFIIGLIVLVIDIVAILEIVKSDFASGKKILWVLLILFLPIIGLILYYLVGRKK